MGRYKAKPRFAAGSLVMFSRKNTESGRVKYTFPVGTPVPQSNWYPRHKPSGEQIADHMERGVPFLLIEDPEFVRFKIQVRAKKKDKTKRVWKTAIEKRWKIRFLFDQKIYHMYLTKRQHDAELVRAVPRRMTKDYGNGTNSRR